MTNLNLQEYVQLFRYTPALSEIFCEYIDLAAANWDKHKEDLAIRARAEMWFFQLQAEMGREKKAQDPVRVSFERIEELEGLLSIVYIPKETGTLKAGQEYRIIVEGLSFAEEGNDAE